MATKLEKGRRVTGERRDLWCATLKKRYDDGASVRELAAWSGRSYGGVYNLLRDAGTKLRKPGYSAAHQVKRGPAKKK